MSYSLSFHQTFSPERDAIGQILQLANRENNEYFTKEEISKLTTIPTGKRSGKVIPSIRYADIFGIVDVEINGERFKLSPTPLGKIINNEDPFLGEDLTLWLCHYNMTTQDSKALLWSFIFNELIPQFGTSFLQENFQTIVNKKFESEVKLTPLRSCYISNERSFSLLGIIKEDDNKYLFSPHRIETSYKYLYGYQLLNSWEKHLEERTEITIDELNDILSFGKPYLWGNREILHVLELLQDERIILLNRQLNPLTIVRKEHSIDLLTKIYSLLI